MSKLDLTGQSHESSLINKFVFSLIQYNQKSY